MLRVVRRGHGAAPSLPKSFDKQALLRAELDALLDRLENEEPLSPTDFKVEGYQKAKFLRKYKGPSGKMVYVYARKKKGRTPGSRVSTDRHEVASTRSKIMGEKKHYTKGSAFTAGAGKGHYIIDEVHPDGSFQIRLTDDGTGQSSDLGRMSYKDFRKRLRADHHEEFRQAAQEGLAARRDAYHKAMAYGTKKQKDRARKLLDDFTKENQTYLKSDDLDKLHGVRGQLLKQAKAVGLGKDEVKQILGVESLKDAAFQSGDFSMDQLETLRLKLESATPQQAQQMLRGNSAPPQEAKPVPPRIFSPRERELAQSVEKTQADLKEALFDLGVARRRNNPKMLREATRQVRLLQDNLMDLKKKQRRTFFRAPVLDVKVQP